MNFTKNTNNLIIFDLDGVLIDSRNNMKNSWSHVKNLLNLKQNFSDYYEFIGLPFEDILKKIGINDYKLISKIKIEYEKNSKKNLNKIKFYPGVKSTLKYLIKKNYKLSIITSKNMERTKLILKDYLNYFNSINTPDLNIKSKPYPDQIFYAIKKAESSYKNTIFIGDSVFDKEAAKAAGVKFFYASYGYGNISNRHSLNKFTEIKNIV